MGDTEGWFMVPELELVVTLWFSRGAPNYVCLGDVRQSPDRSAAAQGSWVLRGGLSDGIRPPTDPTVRWDGGMQLGLPSGPSGAYFDPLGISQTEFSLKSLLPVTNLQQIT